MGGAGACSLSCALSHICLSTGNGRRVRLKLPSTSALSMGAAPPCPGAPHTPGTTPCPGHPSPDPLARGTAPPPRAPGPLPPHPPAPAPTHPPCPGAPSVPKECALGRCPGIWHFLGQSCLEHPGETQSCAERTRACFPSSLQLQGRAFGLTVASKSGARLLVRERPGVRPSS